MKIVRDAAGVHPEMAAQWQATAQRYTAQRAVTRAVRRQERAAPGPPRGPRGRHHFSLVSPEVYVLLTAERGWTPAQWEPWITATLADTILR